MQSINKKADIEFDIVLKLLIGFIVLLLIIGVVFLLKSGSYNMLDKITELLRFG